MKSQITVGLVELPEIALYNFAGVNRNCYKTKRRFREFT
mgnify:CR=1 FL=1